MNSVAEERLSDNLIVSLACGVGIAADEVEHLRVTILALAKEHGLLADECKIEPKPSHSVEVLTVCEPDRPHKRNGWGTRIGWIAAAGALVAFFLAIEPTLLWSTSESAELNFLVNGPPVVTRLVKTVDGHIYVVTLERSLPGYAYATWLSQREITPDHVADELAKIR